MEESDMAWQQELVEWGLECVRRGEVPDMPIPYSKEEDKLLKPVCDKPKSLLIEERISKSRMPMKDIDISD